MTTGSLNAPVTLAGVRLKNPLMNAAFVNSKTTAHISSLLEAPVGAVVVGSISVKPRPKNPGQGYWLHKERFFSLNSFGLPNGGLPYYATRLPEMVRLAHDAGVPLIANVVGFTPEDFATLTAFAQTAGADLVELNLGCPNVWEDGRQKRIISYHASLVTEVLQAVSRTSLKIPVIAKISPLPPDILQEVARAMTRSQVIQAVTAVNSYPNAAITAGARGNAKDPEILAGLAGRALKPISVGVVRQLRHALPKDIGIIGVGGISTAPDVGDYLDAGATAVQMATALVEDGPPLFARILST